MPTHDDFLSDLAQRPAPEALWLSGAAELEVVASRPTARTYVKELFLALGDAGAEPLAAIAGEGSIELTPTSVSVRFTPRDPAAFAGRPSGPARIRATDGRWDAVRVSYAGQSEISRAELFDAAMLVQHSATGEDAVATRIVLAGAAWPVDATIAGKTLIGRPLSKEVTSHFDKRMTLVTPGKLGHDAIADLARAAGFVSGVEVPAIRVECYDGAGVVIESEDRRWQPRVGWSPHSPFTRLPAEARTRAFEALANTLATTPRDGFPLRWILDHIATSYNVRDLNFSAQSLALAIATATSHGYDPALTATDRARLESLRAELLERGYFHEPGYDTGRPQRDIKFLRDIADAIVLNVCGYSGSYYGAEHFTTLELAGRVS